MKELDSLTIDFLTIRKNVMDVIKDKEAEISELKGYLRGIEEVIDRIENIRIPGRTQK